MSTGPLFTDIDTTPAELAWHADHRRGEHLKRRHYWVMGGLIVVGVLLAWWQSSILTFAVMVVCVGAWEVYERWGGQAAVRISEEGVHVNDMHIPHAELTSYDIYRMPDGRLELSLHTVRRTLPRLRIPLHDLNPDIVSLVLAAHVPREKHGLPLVDALLRSPWRT
jgi:hypothetical protein